MQVSVVGRLLKSLGRIDEAESLFRDSLPLITESRGGFDRLVLTNALAEVVQQQGRHEEAERLYRECLDLAGPLLSKKATMGEWMGRIVFHLGQCLAAQNKTDDAEQMYKKVIELENRYWPLDAIKAWVELETRAGQPDAAENVFSQALDVMKQSLARDSSKDTGERPRVDVYKQTVLLFGSTLSARGKIPEAEALYVDAERLMRERKYDSYATEITSALADLKRVQGKESEAEEM